MVNIHKINGKRPFFDIYIGRAVHYTEFTKKSVWANPFPKGDPKCLENYEKYIRMRIGDDPEIYNIESLRGKVLGCWCKPNKCHGDILIKILGEKNG